MYMYQSEVLLTGISTTSLAASHPLHSTQSGLPKMPIGSHYRPVENPLVVSPVSAYHVILDLDPELAYISSPKLHPSPHFTLYYTHTLHYNILHYTTNYHSTHK